MEINFKANLVNKTYIRKYNSSKQKYLPEQVSFVELLHGDVGDKKVLKKITRKWKAPNFANLIYDKFKKRPDYRTFALTTQNDNFEKLDDAKILGLEQISTESGVSIEYLQTMPYTKYPQKDREYKKVGSRMVHCLKKEYYYNKIGANALWSVIDFYYKKHGFDHAYPDEDDLGVLVWRRPERR